MIWVAGRSPTLVSHSLRGVAMNLKATTLQYLAINLYPVIGEQTIAVLFDERAPLLISTNHQSHRGNTHISQNQGRYDR